MIAGIVADAVTTFFVPSTHSTSVDIEGAPEREERKNRNDCSLLA